MYIDAVIPSYEAARITAISEDVGFCPLSQARLLVVPDLVRRLHNSSHWRCAGTESSGAIWGAIEKISLPCCQACRLSYPYGSVVSLQDTARAKIIGL